jgi:FkbM family methyltransferase
VRAGFFGDPYPGILKHILIIDCLGIEHKVHSDKEITIAFNSISEQIALQSSPKLWYDKVGKHIENPLNRLNELHKKLILNYGTFEEEFPEQLLAIKFITSNLKVLEIGGNIGRNTLIINSIVENSQNILTLESDQNIAKALKNNLDENNFNSHVESAALSKMPLIQKGWDTKPFEGTEIPEGWQPVSTITYQELVNKYNIEFDTLVADCEGALYYILRDEPTLLTNIKLVIIENDFHDLEHKQFVDEQFKLHGLKPIFTYEGGWGPCHKFFYEVWSR